MSGNERPLPGSPARHFLLTPLDLVLTLDVMLLAIPLSALGSHLLFGEVRRWAVSLPATLIVIPFAIWRARRHRAPPEPRSNEPLRRTAGVLLMGLGGAVTLLGAVSVFIGLAYVYDTTRRGDRTLVLLPVFFFPLLLGHALMFVGARVRAPSQAG